MSFPKVGLRHKYVRDRLKKYDSVNRFGNTQIKQSMINQVRLAEGEGAAKDLETEFSHKHKKVKEVFSCAGNKQVGICMRFDCSNRGIKCGVCVRNSEYKKGSG
jgi:plasmid maintenance system killer protein